MDIYARQKRFFAKVRAQIIHYYSAGTNACAVCGRTENIEIDHILGGGTRHRREVIKKDTGGYPFFLWLRRNGFPAGYQCLCRECHRQKTAQGAPQNNLTI